MLTYSQWTQTASSVENVAKETTIFGGIATALCATWMKKELNNLPSILHV
jgi:hypothetical protein